MASTPSSPEEDGVALTVDAKTRKEIITIHKWLRHEAPKCYHNFNCDGLCFDYVSYIERDDRPGHADSEARRPNGINANGSSRRASSKVVSLKDYAERAKKKPLDSSTSKLDKPSPSSFNFSNGSRLSLPILFKVASPVHAPPPSETDQIRAMEFHGENDYLSPISTESNRNLKRPSPAPIDRPIKKQRKEPTPKPSTPRSHPAPPPPPTTASPATAKPPRTIKPPPSLPKKPPPPEKLPTKQPTPLKLPILSPELPSVVEDALKADNMVELFGPLVSPTLPSVVEHFLVESERNGTAAKKAEKEMESKEKPTKALVNKADKAADKGLDKEMGTGKAVKEVKKKDVKEPVLEARPKKTATTAQKTTAGKTLKKDKDTKSIPEPLPAKKTTAGKTLKRDVEPKESAPKARAPEEFARKTVMKEKPTATKTLKRTTANLTFTRVKGKNKDKLIMIWAYGKHRVDELKARLKRKRDPKDDFIPPAKKTKTEIPSPLPKKTAKPPAEAASPIPKKSRIEPASPLPKKMKVEPASPLPPKKKSEVSRADAASPQPKKSWNEASSTPRTKPSSTSNITNGTPRAKESSVAKDVTPQKKRTVAVTETPKKNSEAAHTPGDTTRPSEPPPRRRVNDDERRAVRNPEVEKWKDIGRRLKHAGEGKNIPEQERLKQDVTENRVKLIDSVLVYILAYTIDEESNSNPRLITNNWEGVKPLAYSVVTRMGRWEGHSPADDILHGIALLLETALTQHILDLDLEYMDHKIEYYGDGPCRECKKHHSGRCARYFANLHSNLKRICERLRSILPIDILMDRFPHTWGKRSRSVKPPLPKQASQGNLVCGYSLPVNMGPGISLLEVVNVGYSMMAEYCKKKNVKFENRLLLENRPAKYPKTTGS